jgi:hypothetical protein
VVRSRGELALKGDRTCKQRWRRASLERLDPIWEELFPVEQARTVHLMVERIDLSTDSLVIRLRTEGLLR